MSDNLVPKGYIKDPETGYLVAENPRGALPFGIETKRKILELMAKEGSIVQVCEMLGVSTRSVYDHLSIDEAFRRDYAVTIRENCSRLEGTMFKNGQRPQGYMDRITYLRRWMPNEWTPKTNISVSHSDTSALDSLYSAIDPSKVIDAQIIDPGQDVASEKESL